MQNPTKNEQELQQQIDQMWPTYEKLKAYVDSSDRMHKFEAEVQRLMDLEETLVGNAKGAVEGTANLMASIRMEFHQIETQLQTLTDKLGQLEHILILLWNAQMCPPYEPIKEKKEK